MKEIYNAPELSVVSFISAEKLASGVGEFDFDEMENGNFRPADEGSGDLSFDFGF